MPRKLWPPANPRALSRTRTPTKRDPEKLRLLEESLDEVPALNGSRAGRLMKSILTGNTDGILNALRYSAEPEVYRLALKFAGKLGTRELVDVTVRSRVLEVRLAVVELLARDPAALAEVSKCVFWRSPLSRLGKDDQAVYDLANERQLAHIGK